MYIMGGAGNNSGGFPAGVCTPPGAANLPTSVHSFSVSPGSTRAPSLIDATTSRAQSSRTFDPLSALVSVPPSLPSCARTRPIARSSLRCFAAPCFLHRPPPLHPPIPLPSPPFRTPLISSIPYPPLPFSPSLLPIRFFPSHQPFSSPQPTTSRPTPPHTSPRALVSPTPRGQDPPARHEGEGEHEAEREFEHVEIRVKLSTGDWLWRALGMLPVDDVYGGWPFSGES
ncbi:hypothetical protein C8J57DRAFT_1681145 [Mycena rebaudengoi]|nr:hypothetical protein C8J57DRAFT_1681145 [Mycena rebaudengoi]